MCGIIGLLLADDESSVNQMLFDALTVLQHRGQDAAGMVTSHGGRLHLRKENGLVKDVFRTHHMIELKGNFGVGHVRYPTAGSSSCAEAQPLYTNHPFGVCVAHNGNLVNTEELTTFVRRGLKRHVNTDSDSELLLNLFAENLAQKYNNDIDTGSDEMANIIFKSIEEVMEKCRGGYAGLYLINGVGLVGFRDPHGIRPIVFGTRPSASSKANNNKSYSDNEPITAEQMRHANKSLDYVMCSESVAMDALGFDLVRDIKPGEAVFIDLQSGNVRTHQCHRDSSLAPCIFEYVYFARPDSIIDGVSVYESRLNMGEKLAYNIMKRYPDHDIDVVIPIPDTSRTSALQAAYILGRPYREGFIKNRYIARTFIMPGQETRKKSVRLKLNSIKSEFAGRNVLLVDDSIVRGTTSREIVSMAREAGALKVYFTSAAPPIRYPNIYGIDIPTRQELVAYERTEEEIAKNIGADWVVYQDLIDLVNSVSEIQSPDHPLTEFDTSCFSGKYVTGEDITDVYFDKLHSLRNDTAQSMRREQSTLSTMGDEAKNNENLPAGSHHGCESMSNDQNIGEVDAQGGCEAISNKLS